MLMDGANVSSLLAMPYLGDVSIDDPYQEYPPFCMEPRQSYFFKGKAGEALADHTSDTIWYGPWYYYDENFHQQG